MSKYKNKVIRKDKTIVFRYILYRRSKFKCSPLEQIIPSVDVDSTGQRYFLLSTLLKEDKELRHKLKKAVFILPISI